jgi:hypothetical protein
MSTTADSCVARGGGVSRSSFAYLRVPHGPLVSRLLERVSTQVAAAIPGPRERARVGSSSPPDQPVERETSSP